MIRQLKITLCALGLALGTAGPALAQEPISQRATAYHPAVMIQAPQRTASVEMPGVPATVAVTGGGLAASPRFAIKTNALHLASATPQLALELGTGRKTSLELYGAYNNWTFNDNKKWKHWIIQPSLRFWTCERFNGHFFGVHLHAGEYNAGGVGPFKAIKDYRYEGWFAGAGVSYGYQWVLSNRMAIEAEIGAGYARMEYDKFGCAACEPRIGSGSYNYFGPTRAAVTLVFFIR